MTNEHELLAAWRSNLSLLQSAVANWRILAALTIATFAAIFLLGPFFLPIPFALLLATTALASIIPRVLDLVLRFTAIPEAPRRPTKAPISAYVGVAVMLAESVVLIVLPISIMIQRGAFCRYNIICNALTGGG